MLKKTPKISKTELKVFHHYNFFYKKSKCAFTFDTSRSTSAQKRCKIAAGF
jgi:hypothetical protein